MIDGRPGEMQIKTLVKSIDEVSTYTMTLYMMRSLLYDTVHDEVTMTLYMRSLLYDTVHDVVTMTLHDEVTMTLDMMSLLYDTIHDVTAL